MQKSVEDVCVFLGGGERVILVGANANTEETDELVTDFKETEAAKEMLDETD
jgi:hypothetical protein